MVVLEGTEGGAMLGTQDLEALLTIAQNDDPVHFLSPTESSTEEGEVVEFTVMRGGQRNGERVYDDQAHSF